MVYALGVAAASLSVLYVLYQAYDERIWEVEPAVLARLGVATVLGIVVYSFASLLLALAWHAELAWSGGDPRSLAVSIGIYGRAQLAKYAPGNVFSLVGRQLLGRQAGLSHMALAWASLLEVFGMLYAAGLLACAGASGWASAVLRIPQPVFFAGVAALALLPLLFLRSLQSLRFTRRFALPARSMGDYLRLNLLFLIYVPFFVASGLAFVMLLRSVAPGLDFGWFELVSMVSAIWLIGYVTPGASAGIGIRDALLLLAIGGMLDGAAAILSVVAYRVLTILGDVGFFALAVLVRLPIDVQRVHTL